ncbi:MAG: DUF4292 domain-containing protein [Bacteroidota bacterium]
MKWQIVFSLFLLGIIFFGCKSQKILTEKSDHIDETLENHDMIKKGIINKNISDTTVILKNFKVKYSSEKASHNLYGSAKLVQDTAILVSLRAPLGIEISRVLFRPEEVLVLDRKGNRYLVGDYSYLEERFNMNLNFNLVYSLMIGNFPDEYQFLERRDNIKPEFSNVAQDSLYVGEFHQPAGKNYKFQLWIHSSLIRPELFIFYEERNFKNFSVQYFDYNEHSEYYLPGKLQIDGGQEKESYKIDIEYRNGELSSDKRIHFDVPSKFEKIDLR